MSGLRDRVVRFTCEFCDPLSSSLLFFPYPPCLPQQLYKDLQASWLTPVEIFQPHYGQAIANAVLQRWNEQVSRPGLDDLGVVARQTSLQMYE